MGLEWIRQMIGNRMASDISDQNGGVWNPMVSDFRREMDQTTLIIGFHTEIDQNPLDVKHGILWILVSLWKLNENPNWDPMWKVVPYKKRILWMKN